ncbi:hypothetical protein EV121DRAFT_288639 [Schizophyllum commune]
MSYDEHDLPEGWTRQMHEGTPFYVDTRANPPRSIWVHPYEDEQFLRENPGVRPGGARRPSVSPQPSSGGDRGLFGSSHNYQPPMGHPSKHGKAALVEKLIKKVMHSKSGHHQQQQYYPSSQGMSSHYARPQHGGMGGSPFGGGGPGMGMGMGMGHGPGHHGHQGLGGGMGGGGPMFVQQGRPHRRMGGGMGGMGMPLMGGMAGGLLLGEMLDGPDHYGGGFGGGDYGGGGGDWGGGGGGDFGGGGGGFGGGDFGGGGGGGF